MYSHCALKENLKISTGTLRKYWFLDTKKSFIFVRLSLPEKTTENGGEQWFTSDPVPELEHVGLVDAELLHLRRVGGQRGKVLSHVRFL